MPHILHLYRRYWPDEGGIEWTMRTLCEYVARQGQSVTALVASARPWTRRLEHNGVQIMRCATVGTVANTPLCPPMAGWVDRLRPDLIEFHHAYPYGMWALLQSGFRGPLVFHYHFDISRFGRLQGLVRPVLERALDRADCILVNSQGYAETSPVLAPWLDKCRFIPPGVEPDKFVLDVDRQQQVAQLRQDERFRLLFVGRLSPYKGLADLVEAMQWVDGELSIIGRGPLKTELEAQVARLGLADRVRLLGRVGDGELAAYYHAADAVVLPSVTRGESFGVMQVEAMFCGKVVVCSDLPGVCEVGEDGVTSCTFPRGEPRALAETLNQLAAQPERCRQMGAAGRERALALYHLERVLRRRLAVYEDLLGQPLAAEGHDGTA